MKIAILDDYQNAVSTLACFNRLSEHAVTIYSDTVRNVDSLAARLADTEALVLIRERTPVTAALLERLPRLRLISQTGKGVAHIDVEACTRQRVAVAAGVGSPYATAELTWALVLAAMRHLPQEVAELKRGGWQRCLGTGLRGRTLGIYGYGNIGAVVAGYGKAFGMRVLAWGREGSLSRARAGGVETAVSREALFAESDVLCVHLRLSPDTRGCITRSDLAAMKPSAVLVNTSRAELIERGALADALRAGRPGRAAVDVFEEEPVGSDPLLDIDNVVCTPHLGYVEQDSYELYFGAAFDNLNAFSSGRPANLVNPEVLQPL